jgi:hypothetical protein
VTCEVRKAHAMQRMKHRRTSVTKASANDLCQASGQPPGASKYIKVSIEALAHRSASVQYKKEEIDVLLRHGDPRHT